MVSGVKGWALESQIGIKGWGWDLGVKGLGQRSEVSVKGQAWGSRTGVSCQGSGVMV